MACCKSFYYNFIGFSTTDTVNDTRGGFISTRNRSGPAFNNITNEIIGYHTDISNLNTVPRLDWYGN